VKCRLGLKDKENQSSVSVLDLFSRALYWSFCKAFSLKITAFFIGDPSMLTRKCFISFTKISFSKKRALRFVLEYSL
ncbi:hypothetical protein OA240_00790, partial [bacterium]|nr:hypothetical protein [bacterium]